MMSARVCCECTSEHTRVRACVCEQCASVRCASVKNVPEPALSYYFQREPGGHPHGTNDRKAHKAYLPWNEYFGSKQNADV